jgi:hypothetical protein
MSSNPSKTFEEGEGWSKGLLGKIVETGAPVAPNPDAFAESVITEDTSEDWSKLITVEEEGFEIHD